MQGLWSIFWLIASVFTARLMYGKWRRKIIDHNHKVYPAGPAPSTVWQAIASFFVCLCAWWIVLVIMGIMWRPPETKTELEQEKKMNKQQVRDLEYEAETLRAQLARLRSEQQS